MNTYDIIIIGAGPAGLAAAIAAKEAGQKYISVASEMLGVGS